MNTKPQSELAIQTLAMPADTNANGDIFGGWLVSQMDLGAGILAKRKAKGRVTTVAINQVIFHHPVQVGDTVACYAEITEIGRTSMTIPVQVWISRPQDGTKLLVSEAVFIYVAIDDQGRPRKVNAQSPQGE